MLTRHLRRAAIVSGAILAAVFIFFTGVLLRLLVGPISLGPFAGAIEQTLNASVSKLVIHFDEADLEWSRTEGRVNLTIIGTKIFDTGGHIVAQAPKAELDFDAAALFAGHAELKRFALVGMQLTAVRTKEGAVRLGFRSNEGESDVLGVIADALQANSQTVPGADKGTAMPANTLRRFAILDARLAFHDEPTDLFVVSPSTNLTVEAHDGLLDATLNAVIEISGVRATVVAEAQLLGNGMPRHGAVEIHGLSLTALAANSAAFSALAPFGLAFDLTASVDLGPDGTISAADFGIGGSGVIGQPKIDPAMVQIDSFRVLGRYDGSTKRLLLEDVAVEGTGARAKASGHLDVGWEEGGLTSLAGVLYVENAAFNIPHLFPAPVTFERLALRGGYDRAAGKITLDNAVLSAGPLQANITGTITLVADQTPAFDFKGVMAPTAVRDLVRYWPIGVGEGARNWIATNVSQGRLGQTNLELHVPAGALDAEALPDAAVALTFSFEDVTAQYVKGLTLLTGARGSARLGGDTFRADIEQAAIGSISVGKSSVVIPDLHTSSVSATIAAHVEGKVADVLALIDEEPLGYARRFHFDPAQSGGQAMIDLAVEVPLLRDVSVGQLGIDVQARTTNLALPLDALRRIDGGELAFTIDTKTLTAEGPILVDGVPLAFKWVEDFAAAGVTTHLDVQGSLDDAARAKLGLPDAGMVFGPSQILLSLAGRRAQFESGTLRADLRGAVIDVPAIDLVKPAGVPAVLTSTLRFGDNGAISINDFALTGNAINVRGNFDLDSTDNITAASFSIVRVGTGNDFSATAKPTGAGGLAIRIEGRSFDAARLFAGSSRREAKSAQPEAQAAAEGDSFRNPLSLDVKLDRVALKDGLALGTVTLSAVFGPNAHLNAFSLDAAGPLKARLAGRLTQSADGKRQITVATSDAGTLIHGLTGFPSIRRGELMVRATLSPPAEAGSANAPADYEGSFTLRDFTVADQPFLARLFAAGSLDGPLRMLQGEGIGFNKLEAPFTAHGKILTIHDGRASGSAIGFSMQGAVDRGRDTVDLSGSLVPIFGLNSMLGSVPLLGDILVSKKGEGVFGLTYSVSGNIEQPSISVNPLSVLTPGIFRRIFERDVPEPPPAQQAPTTTSGVPTPPVTQQALPPVPPPKP